MLLLLAALDVLEAKHHMTGSNRGPCSNVCRLTKPLVCSPVIIIVTFLQCVLSILRVASITVLMLGFES